MNKLYDYYGQELEIGDMVLGAVAGNRYQQTNFKHSVVVGRTKCMVRLHQINEKACKQDVLNSLKYRGTKRGGKVLPMELIRLEQGFMTRAEIDQYHEVKLSPEGVVLPKALQPVKPKNHIIATPRPR